MELYLPLALKLHAFGLFRLQDAEWCGTDLYQRSKRPYRGRQEPRTLFQEPLADGFLYQLGLWLFEDYVESDDCFHLRDVEFLCEYVEDLIELLQNAGVSPSNSTIKRAKRYLERINALDEDAFYRQTDKTRGQLQSWHEKLHEEFAETFSSAREMYARDYAERVFHDRQLCGYIAQLILDIGIDGTSGDETPTQWCKRLTFPAWVKASLIARDRGHCAACDADIVGALKGVAYVDHIIPLTHGGCNDIVNLQLLCNSCNCKKRAGHWSVKTSIPPYLARALSQKARRKTAQPDSGAT